MAVNRLTCCRLLTVIVVFCILSQFFAPTHYVALLRGGVATAIARNEGSKSDKNRERCRKASRQNMRRRLTFRFFLESLWKSKCWAASKADEMMVIILLLDTRASMERLPAWLRLKWRQISASSRQGRQRMTDCSGCLDWLLVKQTPCFSMLAKKNCLSSCANLFWSRRKLTDKCNFLFPENFGTFPIFIKNYLDME